MARTHVPDLGEVKENLNLGEITVALHEQLKIAQADEDKAGTIEDNVYYEGWVNSLKWVLGILTDTPEFQNNQET